MPIYEYKCTECGAHLEKLQKATDAPLEKCAECGGKLEKQWSLSGFQFKGQGWYVTDYAGKKAEAPASDSSGDPVKTSESDSTETKDSASKEAPEKKAEPKKEKSPSAD